MTGESQSTTQFSSPTGNGAFGGSGTGSGSGGGGGVPPVTADDKAKETPPPDAAQPLSLSDQIAANFAALSSILGTDTSTSGGSYPVPVPVAASGNSSLIWVVLIGAGLAGLYFIFRKKDGHSNDG
jgi:LPXTG-motif cell wall-anchored protein